MKSLYLKIVLALIIIVSSFLMMISSTKESQTTDEAIHLFAGYTYLKEGDFRLDPEHPPLLKELAALPLFLNQKIHYSLNGLWEQADKFYYDSWREARILGEEFFYLSGNNPNQMLFLGRIPFIVLTLILGVFVYFWAEKLYGQKAGLLAMILTLFCPNILAHGHLINTDLGLTLFILLSVYFFGEFLKSTTRRVTTKNLILAGIFVGFAFASKYTAIILLPILIALVLAKMLIDKKSSFGKYFGGLAIVGFLALLIIWGSYGFVEKSFFLLPVSFIKGFFLVFLHAVSGHSSFLLGQTSTQGWWYYFPVAIFFKMPIAFFVFFFLAIIYWKRLRQENIFDELLIIVPPIIFLLFSMSSKANLGVRHILPIFPFLFIFASRSINLVSWTKEKVGTIIFGILILWHISTAFISSFNYLSYFNEFAGGSRAGYQILTDSNLDWGQDIFRIKEYLTEHQVSEGYILYPWNGDSALAYYGIYLKPLSWEKDENLQGKVVASVTYLNQENFVWLWQYPYEQITPGVFIFDVN